MVLCVVFRNRKYRHLEYPLAAFLCLHNLNMYYVAIVLGVFLADLQYNPTPGCLDRFFRDWLCKKPVLYGMLAVGTVLAACPQYHTSIYSILQYIPYAETVAVRAVGLAFVMLALLRMPGLQKGLARPVLVWLGGYSFEIYAIHWPVMLTFETWLFPRLLPTLGYDAASVLSLLLTLPVILVSALAMRWVIFRLTPIVNNLIHFAVRKVRTIIP